VQRNIEALSCNNCNRRNAINIVYSLDVIPVVFIYTARYQLGHNTIIICSFIPADDMFRPLF